MRLHDEVLENSFRRRDRFEEFVDRLLSKCEVVPVQHQIPRSADEFLKAYSFRKKVDENASYVEEHDDRQKGIGNLYEDLRNEQREFDRSEFDQREFDRREIDLENWNEIVEVSACGTAF